MRVSPPTTNTSTAMARPNTFRPPSRAASIFIAALIILLTAGERLLNPQPVGALGLGTLLSVGASLINFFVARVLLEVGRVHRSLALEADAAT